jgi:hypothetical protein
MLCFRTWQDADKRSCPWFDKLTMRAKPLKKLDLILSLSKDEAKIPCFFSILSDENISPPWRFQQRPSPRFVYIR